MSAHGRLPVYPRAEFPRELDVCLTDACNLDCRYCYFTAKARTSPSSLTPAQVERALDLYLERLPARRVQKFSFSGGEPLLRWDSLISGVASARRRLGPRPNIEVFTNGTLLDRRKAEALLSFDPELVISLDGPREVCDAGRRFYGGGGSVFDAVDRNLKALGRGLVSRCFAGSTFSAATVSRMSESVEYLLERGFKCVIVDLDVMASWDRRSLAALRRQAEKLKRLYSSTMRLGFGELQQRLRFDFLISHEELKQVGRPAGLKELSVAPDGRFYPSGLVSGRGKEKARYELGDLGRGFDTARMNAVLSELRGYFGRRVRSGYNGCPTHVYFGRRLSGLSPEPVFDSGERLFAALDPVIGPVIDFELLQNSLASDKTLGDFDHPPRLVPPPGLRSLRFASGLNAGAARDAADAALHSPGDPKSLAMEKGVAAGPDSLRRISACSLMKARRLGRRLRFTVVEGS
ncbi:MAG: radical SAM protein [Elusimicrobiales bacterium]|nr:radical SAM protein [Elusimicrobiales bacterium]